MSALGGAARASAGSAFRLPNAAATTPSLVPLAPCSSSSSQKQQASSLFAAPSRRRSVARQASPTTMLIELGLAAAAAWAITHPETDPSRGGNRDCATCGGTGKEECACVRWSDSDVGCRTCSFTGRAPCRSCGGGGTAVPVALTARKLAPEDIKRLQAQQERDRRHRG